MEHMPTHAEERPGYRPVSGLAVAAAALGIASALALTSPLMWVLPLVGVAVAVAALGDVGRSGVTKAGRLAAVAGLALSVGFGSQAVSAWVATRWFHAWRAEAAAGLWIDAIREGRLDDARSVCMPGTASAVDALAACSVGPFRPGACTMGRDDSQGWVVAATLADCELEIEVKPEPPIVGGPAFERWTVVRCVVVRRSPT